MADLLLRLKIPLQHTRDVAENSLVKRCKMEQYKREFIQFLEGAGVLKFGDFTAKSGRKIP